MPPSEKFSTIPQSVARGEPLDQEGMIYFSEINRRLKGNSTTTPGAVRKMPAIADASGGTDTSTEAKLNELLAALRAAGALAE